MGFARQASLIARGAGPYGSRALDLEKLDHAARYGAASFNCQQGAADERGPSS